MLLISQNLLNYDMEFPKNTVLRINLAWVSSLDKLTKLLDQFTHDVFLDLPTGRKKPPNYRYTMSDLASIIQSYPSIKYFAISNVESISQIKDAYSFLPKSVTLVPKIESILGIKSIDKIAGALREKQKMVMLDHDDLFSNIISENQTVDYYIQLIDSLVDYCKSAGVGLLRTRGVIFSEDI